MRYIPLTPSKHNMRDNLILERGLLLALHNKLESIISPSLSMRWIESLGLYGKLLSVKFVFDLISIFDKIFYRKAMPFFVVLII